MSKFVDEGLDKADAAGNFMRKILVKILGKGSKGFLALCVLLVMGLAVFIGALIYGRNKK